VSQQGRFAASQRSALIRLRHYLELAEKGNTTKLLADLDANTQDVEAHPNAVILEAVMMLTGFGKGSGRSMVGWAEQLIRDFGKRSTKAGNTGIWTPPGTN
jgi:hypothetical protein